MLLRENEDGSADYAFDLTAEEKEMLIKYGIMEAIKAAMKDGENLTVEGKEIEG
jgi:serine/threonine protein kinase HipA of HipAB toxin-antitoxin module